VPRPKQTSVGQSDLTTPAAAAIIIMIIIIITIIIILRVMCQSLGQLQGRGQTVPVAKSVTVI